MNRNIKMLCAVASIMLGLHLLHHAAESGTLAETDASVPSGPIPAEDELVPPSDGAVGSASAEEGEATTCTRHEYEVAFNGGFQCTLNENGPYYTHRLYFDECVEVVFRTASGELDPIPVGDADCPSSRDPTDDPAESVSAIYNPRSWCKHKFKLSTASPTCKIEITVNPVN